MKTFMKAFFFLSSMCQQQFCHSHASISMTLWFQLVYTLIKMLIFIAATSARQLLFTALAL